MCDAGGGGGIVCFCQGGFADSMVVVIAMGSRGEIAFSNTFADLQNESCIFKMTLETL